MTDLTLEVDPVNVVLGLMALLVSMTMLVMKLYKNCGPHGRRNRRQTRHHNRRRTSNVLPTHEPPRKHHSQHGQPQQSINNELNAGISYHSRHATLPRSRRSPHSNSTTPQPQAVANSTTTPATVTLTPTSAPITSNATPAPVTLNP